MPRRTADPSVQIVRTARFSGCGTHRLLLERTWSVGPTLGFVMLNPSTADGEQDDPTVRRCLAFARAWGYGGVLVANLFTLRASDPRALMRAAPGARTTDGAHEAWREVAQRCDLVIEAWGSHRAAPLQASAARRAIAGTTRGVLGRTRDGSPRHPLYVPGATRPVDAASARPLTLPIDGREKVRALR